MDAIAKLLIEQECRNVVLRAAAFADGHNPVGLALLFAPDAVLIRPNEPPIVGRDGIRQAYERRPKERITRHLVTNTMVEVESESRARACSYVLLWTGSALDESGPHGRLADERKLVGEFNDVFSLGLDGQWLIQRREARFVLHN